MPNFSNFSGCSTGYWISSCACKAWQGGRVGGTGVKRGATAGWARGEAGAAEAARCAATCGSRKQGASMLGPPARLQLALDALQAADVVPRGVGHLHHGLAQRRGVGHAQRRLEVVLRQGKGRMGEEGPWFEVGPGTMPAREPLLACRINSLVAPSHVPPFPGVPAAAAAAGRGATHLGDCHGREHLGVDVVVLQVDHVHLLADALQRGLVTVRWSRGRGRRGRAGGREWLPAARMA